MRDRKHFLPRLIAVGRGHTFNLYLSPTVSSSMTPGFFSDDKLLAASHPLYAYVFNSSIFFTCSLTQYSPSTNANNSYLHLPSVK